MACAAVAELEMHTRTPTSDDYQQVEDLGARVANALVGDAGVMAGLGSVPLGRWHGPARDCGSSRCGRSTRSEKARSAINLWLRK